MLLMPFSQIRILAVVALAGTCFAQAPTAADRRVVFSAEEIAVAMKRASAFMFDTVAYRGGFVSLYTEDLSERWGEVPARNTMVWVQDPGTVGVARVLLNAYLTTGDVGFLRHCEEAANALALGQHPSGGWHYFIDFDPGGTRQWYNNVGARCWGWEEFYHYGDNCTFDDNVTTGAADLLLDLYLATRDLKRRAPLLKAIQFILDSQYPLGGWPQRYPLQHARAPGSQADYASFYTFNDGVIVNNIFFLLKAHQKLSDVQYQKAAERGMHFVLNSQFSAPQAGWAQQYDMGLHPGQARSYEPAGLDPSTTVSNIGHLMTFYKITGDASYLRGIPDALAWLDRSRLPPGHSAEGHTHAQFVEVGTNRPLYAHREGTGIADGRYWVDYEPGNFPGHYGMQLRIDADALRAEYRRVAALTPAAASAEYLATLPAEAVTPAVSADDVRRILESMDDRGAWLEELSVPDYSDWKFKPRRHFRGISTQTYITNMRQLLQYLRALQEAGGSPLTQPRRILNCSGRFLIRR